MRPQALPFAQDIVDLHVESRDHALDMAAAREGPVALPAAHGFLGDAQLGPEGRLGKPLAPAQPPYVLSDAHGTLQAFPL